MTVYKHKYINKRVSDILFILVSVIIVLYPLRWSWTGLDFWDIGYSCGNYVYFGLDHMSSVWFFSTYLSNVTGHMLSMLPYGDTLVGLKLYCSLILSILIIISGSFCIAKIGINRWIVAAGELLAVSLCYCPPVILYNVITYFLLLIAIMLIYNGLTEGKDIYLFGAGLLLGLNVFVRFSNITQTALIFAVWMYLWMNKCRIKEYLNKTIVCVMGYGISVGMMITIISIRYGLENYLHGIHELFALSDSSEGYSPIDMIFSMAGAYIRGFRRLADMMIFTLAAILAVYVIERIMERHDDSKREKQCVYIVSVITGMLLCVYMIARRLIQFDFHHYITIILTAALFLDISGIAAILIFFNRNSSKEKKLFALLLVMQMVVLSVGSNTGIAPVVNSMFMIAPFMLWNISCYVTSPPVLKAAKVTTMMIKKTWIIVSGIVLALCYVQCIMFGAGYTFQEANNGVGGSGVVMDNRVARGTRTTQERIEWLHGLTAHIDQNKYNSKEVIIYGYAPALAFYLELEPAITSWPDLDSYSVSEMRQDLARLEVRIDNSEADKPVIILDNANVTDQREHNPEKWDMLETFMDKYEYGENYNDGRFSIYY